VDGRGGVSPGRKHRLNSQGRGQDRWVLLSDPNPNGLQLLLVGWVLLSSPCPLCSSCFGFGIGSVKSWKQAQIEQPMLGPILSCVMGRVLLSGPNPIWC
jgi:hypothetical protein